MDDLLKLKNLNTGEIKLFSSDGAASKFIAENEGWIIWRV